MQFSRAKSVQHTQRNNLLVLSSLAHHADAAAVPMPSPAFLSNMYLHGSIDRPLVPSLLRTARVSAAKQQYCNHGVSVGEPDASDGTRAFQAEAGAHRHGGVPRTHRQGKAQSDSKYKQ